ncbi:MAG: hypothetical protein AB1Z98_08405 [Nannocystaceae bacterium]
MRSWSCWSWVYAGGVLGLAVGAGCFRYAPNHCGNNEGDATCRDRELGMFCDLCVGNNDGCVNAQPPADCYWEGPETDGDSSSGSGSETGGGSTTTTTDATVDDGSSTGPVPCVTNEDCADPLAPFCEPASGDCLSCEVMSDPDGACAGLDADEPLCVGGACVACTPRDASVCDVLAQICDEQTNACVPCTEHAQCDSGACELAGGQCFPTTFVATVDGDAGSGADYPSIAAAVGAVGDGQHGVIVVHELDGGADYGGVLVDGGKTIALLAASGEAPIVQGTGSNPGLRVEGAGTGLYVDGLSVTNAAVQGVTVDQALAWLDRSRIVQNAGGGILASNAAQLTLRNCFVGGSVNNVPALSIEDATATIAYSTLIGGLGSTAETLACTAGASVTVSDSLVLLQSDNSPVTCDPATFDHCASEMMLPGADNIDLGSFNDVSPWFVNVGTGDFHLATPPAQVATAAQWNEGDPSTDIDDMPRPTTDGATDVVGADLP